MTNHDLTLERALELKREGFDLRQAWGRAWLEDRITNWPPAWGDDLQILIYGDFEPPKRELHFPELGITVYPEKQEGTLIRSAMCVLKADVKITEKSLPAILDAARRINSLLGAWNLVEWGNSACGWWSHITSGSIGGAISNFDSEDLPAALTGIEKLPEPVRQKVYAALYWVREPRNLMMEQFRSDILRIYAGYWNAFECLVDAVIYLRPMPKLSRAEKQSRIDQFISARNGKLKPADVAKCYQEIVNPGFVGKAKHALQQCFPQQAEEYANECFHRLDRENRLYDIRNAINHGDIDAEHPEELLRVDSRLHKLWMIVWRIFGRLVPFSAPTENPNHSQDFK